MPLPLRYLAPFPSLSNRVRLYLSLLCTPYMSFSLHPSLFVCLLLCLSTSPFVTYVAKSLGSWRLAE